MHDTVHRQGELSLWRFSAVFLVLVTVLGALRAVFVLLLTFLYVNVKYGRRHYLCGHVYH